METSVSTAIHSSVSGSEREVSPARKPDCYFYYYSSCNKGNACPFRHEPAALRNETMCVYWLKGSCNKPHCIYRHMEITKKRDKIQCFFENQPGGCKKLHCPFLHNNVLDRPRDEDVPKHSDLILPVKDSEGEYENEQSEIKKLQDCVSAQLKIQRKLSHNLSANAEEEATPPELQPPCITRKSFIVPLCDGESDSESVSGSPAKGPKSERHCIVSEAESDWELERLREIQKEEGFLLGYSFAADGDDPEEHSASVSPSLQSPPYYDEIEEIVETYDQDTISKTIVRRNFEMPDQDGYIKRVLGPTLKKKEGREPVKQFLLYDTEKKAEDYVFGLRMRSPPQLVSLPIRERLGPKNDSQKPSVKERLGMKKVFEAEDASESTLTRKAFSTKRDESLPKSLSAGKEEGLKARTASKGEGIKSRLTIIEDSPPKMAREENFGIKSLADIKAEKGRLKQPPLATNATKVTTQTLPMMLPLSALISKNKDPNKEVIPDIGNIKVKTLAEIRAEKEKFNPFKPTKNTSLRESKSTKRSISPISFESDFSRNVKTVKDKPRTNGETKSLVKNETSSHFSPRKLALKKLKTSATEGKEISTADAPKENALSRNISAPSDSRNINSSKPEMAVVQRSKSESNHKVHPTCDVSTSNDPVENLLTMTDSSEEDKITTIESKIQVGRLDSFIDEEELLLEGDITTFEDEEIDEDELLL